MIGGGDAGGGSGRAIAVDAAGNVAVTGYFRGTVDLGGAQLAYRDARPLFQQLAGQVVKPHETNRQRTRAREQRAE